MPTAIPDDELNKKLAERFAKLPKVVQDAINSAEVEQHLRDLADTHKLHLDQWSTLENEVMLTLLGFQKTEDLAKNIESEVGVDTATATALAESISKIVFEPIRSELERKLEHPEAEEEKKSGVETVRNEVLAKTGESAPVPATPPPAAPDGKAERAPISSSYASSTPSHERPTIDGDPYREQVS